MHDAPGHYTLCAKPPQCEHTTCGSERTGEPAALLGIVLGSMRRGLDMDLSVYFADQCQQGRYSGSVFVWREGQVLLDAGYGLARREMGRPNAPKTTFQLASVSKQFTAGAILLLQEQGALSVSDRLSRWLPESPEAWQPMTLHHLLTHTSGIGHWQDFPMLKLDQPIARDELLAIFQRRPLLFSSGGWAYSSPGYVLLAHVVEQVTGEPYAS